MTDYSADLKRAYAVLTNKHERLTRFFLYYDGETTVSPMTERLAQALGKLNIHFAENWCAPVVDTLLDRLNLAGFKVESGSQDDLDAFFVREQLEIESDETHSDVAIAGESYVIVWPDAEGVTRLFHNDPRMCHVWYDGADPRKKAFAAKWWLEDETDDAARLMTLYYADGFAHFRSKEAAAHLSSAQGFELESEEPNEYGVLPVFHLRTRRRKAYGELQNAITIQVAINHLADDMMVAAEYSAFKQRWAITEADPSDLRAAPNTTITIPPAPEGTQPVSVGEFTASELANYIGAIEHKANALAAITRTPKPVFFQVGGNVSGDALIAMEAQLAKKAGRYQERLGASWAEVASFVYLLGGEKVPADKIEPVWEDEHTVQPTAEADALTKLVTAGVPLKTALRWTGHSEDELDQMDKDSQEAQGNKASLAADMLLKARQRMNAGPPGTALPPGQTPTNPAPAPGRQGTGIAGVG